MFRMNGRNGRSASYSTAISVVFGLGLLLAGCSSMSILRPPETSATFATTNVERAAAIADMRAKAEAGDTMPFPDAYQSERTNRLALRGEPRSVPEVQAIAAELSVIAKRRATTTDPSEIAALDKRAKELRRLALASQALRE
jgi:hypothetical protein